MAHTHTPSATETLTPDASEVGFLRGNCVRNENEGSSARPEQTPRDTRYINGGPRPFWKHTKSVCMYELLTVASTLTFMELRPRGTLKQRSNVWTTQTLPLVYGQDKHTTESLNCRHTIFYKEGNTRKNQCSLMFKISQISRREWRHTGCLQKELFVWFLCVRQSFQMQFDDLPG